MALFQPTYIDKKTGERKASEFWWVDFTIGGKRVRESAEPRGRPSHTNTRSGGTWSLSALWPDFQVKHLGGE
jgi:hypothetical protein